MLFKTTGTQTDDFVVHGVTKMRPDDVNKLCHLEDHTYSLGPNNYHSTDEDGVEPCITTCTPGPENQLVLAEGDAIHDKMNVDAINPVSSDQADGDALSDSGSLYCPSVSDNESATDDEFSSSTTPCPSVKNKFIVFEIKLYKLFTHVMIVVVLLMVQLSNVREVWLQLLQTVLMGILYPGNHNPQLKVVQQETY